MGFHGFGIAKRELGKELHLKENELQIFREYKYFWVACIKVSSAQAIQRDIPLGTMLVYKNKAYFINKADR